MKSKWLALPFACTPVLFVASCSQPVQQVYVVKKFDSGKYIDWNAVPKVPVNIYKWVPGGPTYGTYAQMIYIPNQGFSVHMFSNEPDPLIEHTKDDDVYLDSCLEVYFRLPNQDRYFNVEVEPANNSRQEFGLPWSSGQGRTLIKGSGFGFDSITNIAEGVSWQVYINLSFYSICHWYQQVGVIINPTDFVSGTVLYGNFYKTCGTKGPKEHYGMWNEIVADDHSFHHPEQFGKLILE